MASPLVATNTWLVATETIVQFLILFLFFAGVALATRITVRRRCSPERQAELAGHAGKAITGIASSFAFFVGFAITISWGAVSTEQKAIEDTAVQAQQLAWTVNRVADETQAHVILGQLHTYVVTVTEEDGPLLARGQVSDLPSQHPLEALQDSVHVYVTGPGSTDPVAETLATNVASLSEAAASLAVVSQRSLPPLLSLLIFVSAVLLQAVGGMSDVTISRPPLLPVWALLASLAIWVIPAPGSIGVDLSPLYLVTERLIQ